MSGERASTGGGADADEGGVPPRSTDAMNQMPSPLTPLEDRLGQLELTVSQLEQRLETEARKKALQGRIRIAGLLIIVALYYYVMQSVSSML